MKVSKTQIDNFFRPRQIAIAGVSRNEKKFGNMVFKELLAKGFGVIPINPNATSIDGHQCYPSVELLPGGIDSILITTPKDQTDEILRQSIKKGIPNIWVQQMSETENTLKIAEDYNTEIIFDKCIFMFAYPVKGIHKFHRTMAKIFGKLPK
ncbi:MAG: CoA-binding protein [Bacteroidales bacterium]|nr:CoA-binding protein [Bacteroidales bacterium]